MDRVIIRGLVAGLCAWGVGFRGWVQVLAVGSHEDASIVGRSKVSIGMSSQVKLVIKGCVDTLVTGF